jgi:hypothetical protein
MSKQCEKYAKDKMDETNNKKKWMLSPDLRTPILKKDYSIKTDLCYWVQEVTGNFLNLCWRYLDFSTKPVSIL